MKGLFYTLACASIVVSAHVLAAQPTHIDFSRTSQTFLGVKYTVYTVRCSDGTRREITAWNGKSKWCVGTSRDCTSSQLEAAQRACASESS